MRFGYRMGGILVVAAALAAGCAPKEAARSTTAKGLVAEKKHDHSTWWCAEHGIPEHECSMCLPEAVVNREFKAKGDWCELHNRAKSQCFKCDPALKEKFAAKYRARYGKEPPPIGEEEEKK